MGFPDNRIRQEDYKKAKGITDKVFCGSCKKIAHGLMFMDSNNRRVCGACAGRAAEGLTSGDKVSKDG